MDVHSKTDSFCILWWMKGAKGQVPKKVMQGKTECIMDNLDPTFVTAIECDFYFEEQHTFMLEVYDADDHTNLNALDK